MTLPNYLTLLRLLAAPLVPVLFVLVPRPFADLAALALFIAASATDWLDGVLARRWGQITRLGAMLDPIADKAMVTLALLTLVAVSSLSWPMLLPAVVILFREVFVSGLREYLGDVAGTLRVTALAKWKTTVQMLALAVLFLHGVFEHQAVMAAFGMDPVLIDAVLRGEVTDAAGLRRAAVLTDICAWGGLAFLCLAAVLTLVTGADYLRKALPFLKEPR